MSHEASAWAWRQPVGSRVRKLVLVALADRASSEGWCWPGYDEIAARCEMSRESARQHLRQLEADGLVVRFQRRWADSGKQRHNVYLLLIGDDAPGQVAACRPQGVSEQAVLDAFEPVPVDGGENSPPPENSPPKNHQQENRQQDHAHAHEDDRRFPKRIPQDGLYVDALERWAETQGVELPNSTDLYARHRKALGLVLDELGRTGQLASALARRVICEYATAVDGEDVPRPARRQLDRLARTYHPATVLDAVRTALDAGAGLDPEYADDSRSLVKYASAVLSGQRARAATA